MNKVICDMCGTSYAETSSQCPICGYARQEDAKVVFEPDESADSKQSRVRGGRFSAANVRKINSSKLEEDTDYAFDSDEPENTRNGLNLALAITAIVLFILLVVVLISFGKKIADNAGKYDQISSSTMAVKQNEIPCTSIDVGFETVELNQMGDTAQISYTAVPSNTTDIVRFSSNAPEIATVNADGTISAVSSGEAVITVSCGTVEQNIVVTCSFDTAEEDSWSLNREEFSLLKKGETWDLYSNTSKISKVHISWSSDDESIATVDSGIVTAVAPGSTTIHAEYNGKKLSCKVLCKFEDEGQDNTQENVDVDSLKLSSRDDVTLIANQADRKSFELYLKDKNGTRVDVTWTASKEGVVQIEGSKITGIKAGAFTVLEATYGGKTFKCTVRVS